MGGERGSWFVHSQYVAAKTLCLSTLGPTILRERHFKQARPLPRLVGMVRAAAREEAGWVWWWC